MALQWTRALTGERWQGTAGRLAGRLGLPLVALARGLAQSLDAGRELVASGLRSVGLLRQEVAAVVPATTGVVARSRSFRTAAPVATVRASLHSFSTARLEPQRTMMVKVELEESDVQAATSRGAVIETPISAAVLAAEVVANMPAWTADDAVAEDAVAEDAAVGDDAEDDRALAIEARDSEPEPEPNDGDEIAEESASAAAAEVEAADGSADEEVTGQDRLDSIVESLLLAAGAPLPVRRMVDVLGGAKSKEVREALARLAERYGGADRGIHLVEVAGGYQFRTAPANAKYVRALLREKPGRLGRAAMETLSIVAYKQPVTRGEIEVIRGVDADSAINTLLARKLIKIDGRKETVGRPLLYATTAEFLEVFGLKDLRELPTLKEIGPVPEPEYDADIEEEDNGPAGFEEAIAEAAGASEGRTGADGQGAAREASAQAGRQADGEDCAVAVAQDDVAVVAVGQDDVAVVAVGQDDVADVAVAQDDVAVVAVAQDDVAVVASARAVEQDGSRGGDSDGAATAKAQGGGDGDDDEFEDKDEGDDFEDEEDDDFDEADGDDLEGDDFDFDDDDEDDDEEEDEDS